MTEYKFDAAEIHENRETLQGIEVLLNELYCFSIYEREQVETEIIVQALANDSKTRLRKALAWLEEMVDEAETRETLEAAQ